MALSSSTTTSRAFWRGLGSVLDVAGTGLSWRRRSGTPLQQAWRRVETRLASIPNVDQSNIEPKRIGDEQEISEFALREALLTAVQRQHIALEERAEVASTYLHDNPEKARTLFPYPPLVDPITARLIYEEDFVHFPDYWRFLFDEDYWYWLTRTLGVSYASLLRDRNSRYWYRYGYRYPGLWIPPRDVELSIRRRIQTLLERPDSDEIAPYINYLAEVLRTIELEILVEPYLRLSGGITYAHFSRCW